MTDEEYIDALADALDIEVQAIEASVLVEIAKALRDPDPSPAKTAALMRRIEKAVGGGAADVERAVGEAMGHLEKANAEWAAPYYEASGAAMGAAAAEAVAAGREAAAARVRDLMDPSVMEICVKEGGRVRSKPIREAYGAVVTAAAAELAQGAGTPQKAVSEAVASALGHMAESGVRVRYASGATRELYGAVRMNVLDAYRRSMQAGREAMGREFGADGVEVSAHGTCAPDHLPYQGRTFSNADFEKVQSRLERPIAQGYNCRHNAHPVLLGVLAPAHDEAQLEAMREASEREVTFAGARGERLTMTRYEATQYQRRLEQSIRRANLEAQLATAAGADPSAHKAAAKRLRGVYRAMSEACELETDLKRTRVHLRK